MQYILNPPFPARLRRSLDLFFAGLGQGVNAYMLARSRTAQLERMNAKTDEELAQMGLRREDIPRHVFRDLIY